MTKPGGLQDHQIRLMVVDEEPLMLDLLEQGLSKVEAFEVVGRTGSPQAAPEVAAESKPDVVLIVSRAEHLAENMNAGRIINSVPCAPGIVLLAEREDLHVLKRQVFDQGPGWSFLLRDSMTGIHDLEHVIHSSAKGLTTIGNGLSDGDSSESDKQELQLTFRQRRVLALVTAGLSNQGIAEQLEVSNRTVEYHLNEVYRRMEYGDTIHFNRRVCAAMQFRESGEDYKALPPAAWRHPFDGRRPLPALMPMTE